MGPLVWGLYELTGAKESPKSPGREWQETDKVSAFPQPLTLHVCLAIWEQEEMGGNQSKNIPLEYMINDFKKGFKGV
jgi:hypothetical protein